MSEQASKVYSEMGSIMPQRPVGRSSLRSTVMWCLYFLVAGWAVSRVFPILMTLLAGMGFAISSDSIFLYLLFHSDWLIATGVAILVIVVLIRQFSGLSDIRRRLINRFLIVSTIVSIPFVVARSGLPYMPFCSGRFK